MSTTTDGFPYPPASDALGNGHQWMQDMAEFLDGKYIPWTTYTPAIAGLTLGNGVLHAQYRRLFDTVDFRLNVTFGSTTSVGGTLGISYAPGGLTPSDADGAFEGFLIGECWALEASAPSIKAGVLMGSTLGTAYMHFDGTASIAGANATVPFAWNQDDQFKVHGSFRVI